MPKVKAEVRWDQQTSQTDASANRIFLTLKFNQVRVLPEVDIVETAAFTKVFIMSHMNSQYDVSLEIPLYGKVRTLYICEKTPDGFHLILTKSDHVEWPRLTRAKKMPVEYHLVCGNDGSSLSHFQHVQSPSIIPEVGCKQCAERKDKFPLMALPPHLMKRVAQFVPHEYIPPLSNACRRLNSICEPILWHTFTIPCMKHDHEAYKRTGKIEEIWRLVQLLKSDKAKKHIRELKWLRNRLHIPQKGFHAYINAQIDALIELSQAISQLPHLAKLALDMRMEISPGYRCGLTNGDYTKLNRPTFAEDALRMIPSSSTLKRLTIECSQFLTFNSIFQDMSTISSLDDFNLSKLAEIFPGLDYLKFVYVGRSDEDDELFNEYDKAFMGLPYEEIVMVYAPQVSESKTFEYRSNNQSRRTYARDDNGELALVSSLFIMGPLSSLLDKK